ncbi:MAG: NADH-quinone oxidoreductase subunit NuoF [Halanaerobium sp.]|nr:NADH-quinone oxidoreductase subunit NuoF [Halanaerobium sp.]
MYIFRAHVLVCTGSACVVEGAMNIKKALVDEIEKKGLSEEIKVVETGCLGPCAQAPVIVVYPDGVVYGGLHPDDVPQIVEEHLLKGRPVKKFMLPSQQEEHGVVDYQQKSFFAKESRVVLRHCGQINPEEIEDYISQGGYEMLGKVVTEYEPEDVIEIIKESGLRGRGGAGFPTGVKWGLTAPGEKKYLICNADEGEPGTFKDRLILEGDPHSVLEGMAIAAYAVGADEGYIYIRGEYPISIERIQRAIKQAEDLNLLGENIFGSGFNIKLMVREGAGAYVCGEETALIESMEGDRGEPRVKPPFPGQAGLWGKPTVVNNVETLANVPVILEKGPEWFKGLGTEQTPGTKVFTLTGNINNEGLIEVPMGITLREIIYDIGGGIPEGRGFKLAQTGGTTGGCLPEEFLDVPLDFDTLAEKGSSLGSGALLIMDDSHCVVDILKCFMKFFKHESCGKCTPCREGTTRLYNIFAKISRGEGERKDLEQAIRLSRVMQSSALCGLGQGAVNPVFTIFKYFKDEVEAHLDGICPAGVCGRGDIG